MENNSPAQRTVNAGEAGILPAQYLYCLALGKDDVRLGGIGIDGHDVYSVVHGDICALVHPCSARAYEAGDDAIAKSWVMAHHHVVETAWKRWGAVLPVAFNTIVQAQERSAEENLIEKMKSDYGVLKGKLEALAGKAEYVVQVFCDPIAVLKQVAETTPEIERLQAGLDARPPGLQYMYRQKLEGLLRKQTEIKASAEFKELYERLSRHVDKIQVERNKPADGVKQMLVNLSCLVSTDKHGDLESALDSVGRLEGYSVRLAGPLPPYTFC